MSQALRKQEYLAGLQVRVDRNRQVVETEFMDLDQEERSWQPAPGEWSVDQCFQHLVISFEDFLPSVTEAMKKPEPADADGMFRPSWWGRRLMGKLWNPQNHYATKKKMIPQEHYYPDVFTRFLQQPDQLSALIEEAEQADLQTPIWFHKNVLIRFNLGDMLLTYVGHDELHIDQARRALQAYRQRDKVGALRG